MRTTNNRYGLIYEEVKQRMEKDKEHCGSASAQLPLLDCKCGGTPELDWSGANEFYGHAWQTVDITCNGKCGRSVTTSIDGDNTDEARLGETLVIEMWNRLQGVI